MCFAWKGKIQNIVLTIKINSSCNCISCRPSRELEMKPNSKREYTYFDFCLRPVQSCCLAQAQYSSGSNQAETLQLGQLPELPELPGVVLILDAAQMRSPWLAAESCCFELMKGSFHTLVKTSSVHTRSHKYSHTHTHMYSTTFPNWHQKS